MRHNQGPGRRSRQTSRRRAAGATVNSKLLRQWSSLIVVSAIAIASCPTAARAATVCATLSIGDATTGTCDPFLYPPGLVAIDSTNHLITFANNSPSLVQHR